MKGSFYHFANRHKYTNSSRKVEEQFAMFIEAHRQPKKDSICSFNGRSVGESVALAGSGTPAARNGSHSLGVTARAATERTAGAVAARTATLAALEPAWVAVVFNVAWSVSRVNCRIFDLNASQEAYARPVSVITQSRTLLL